MWGDRNNNNICALGSGANHQYSDSVTVTGTLLSVVVKQSSSRPALQATEGLEGPDGYIGYIVVLLS